MLPEQMLVDIVDRPVNDNMRSFLAGLSERGELAGLDRPHRLAHFIAQITHENHRFRYDREIWGPTPAQRRYDIRTDLGNTAARDGDGKKYMGRGPIQITGKSNYRQFTDWCRAVDADAPDFVENPDAVNTDPWEGLVAIWYWETRNLNSYADRNDIEMVTRRINGGLNGYADRLRMYDHSALVMLGYDRSDVKAFQAAHGLVVDGISGPRTRGAMHKALQALKPFSEPKARPVPAPTPKPTTNTAAAIEKLEQALAILKA